MFTSESVERHALRETVAALAGEYGHAYYAQQAESGEFPSALWSRLADAGFAGVNVPADIGGGGGSLADLAAVAEEVAKAGCPLMTLVVSPGVCGPLLEAFGNDHQRQAWLSGIGSGQLRMAFALTEPDAGANTRRLRTHAKRTGDGWTIRGEKQFISGVEDASAVMVVARTGTDADSGDGRLSLFVVDTHAAGLSASPIAMQVRAAERQSTLLFDDVTVPAAALVGEEGAGFRQLFVGLNPERIISAATCIGIARYALSKAAEYARTRAVWDVPIGAHQAIAHPLARAHVAIEASALLLERACALHDAGDADGAMANMAKFAASEAAEISLDAAIQTHGGNGLADEYGLADLWGLTRMYRIAPVSNEMTLNHIAVHELGLPRSY